MSVKKYADSTGLTEFWAKVKAHVTSAISGKQDTLVSGTNIKTVGNESILGSGNIDVTGNQLVELTQAEYDALSSAEKNNGKAYFITDGEPDYTIINDSVPIGAIQAYGGSTAPYGWLICDGSAVSRVTYSELFTAIGTRYGSGDSSTTFNLPDLRGRVAIGVSSSHALASTGGEETHTLTVSEMPSHYHILTSLQIEGYSGWGSATNNRYGLQLSHLNNTSASSHTANRAEISTDSRGSTAAHNNMQPYIATNYIIKALNTLSSGRLDELDPQHILFDIMHPIGSYYETSDSTFDPNEVWTGTWVSERTTDDNDTGWVSLVPYINTGYAARGTVLSAFDCPAYRIHKGVVFFKGFIYSTTAKNSQTGTLLIDIPNEIRVGERGGGSVRFLGTAYHIRAEGSVINVYDTATIAVQNEARGYHLSCLSYVLSDDASNRTITKWHRTA